MTEPLYTIADGLRVLMSEGEAAELLALRESVADSPELVPAAISDRQFAHGLWKRGLISFDEALAFVTVGAVPPPLALIVGGLPDEIRDDVALMLAGATEFLRAHPAVAAIAAAFGWDADAADDFWRFASTL